MTIDARGGVDRMEKKRPSRGFQLCTTKMHNCIKYYNWFLDSGRLFN